MTARTATSWERTEEREKRKGRLLGATTNVTEYIDLHQYLLFLCGISGSAENDLTAVYFLDKRMWLFCSLLVRPHKKAMVNFLGAEHNWALGSATGFHRKFLIQAWESDYDCIGMGTMAVNYYELSSMPFSRSIQASQLFVILLRPTWTALLKEGAPPLTTGQRKIHCGSCTKNSTTDAETKSFPS